MERPVANVNLVIENLSIKIDLTIPAGDTGKRTDVTGNNFTKKLKSLASFCDDISKICKIGIGVVGLVGTLLLLAGSCSPPKTQSPNTPTEFHKIESIKPDTLRVGLFLFALILAFFWWRAAAQWRKGTRILNSFGRVLELGRRAGSLTAFQRRTADGQPSPVTQELLKPAFLGRGPALPVSLETDRFRQNPEET